MKVAFDLKQETLGSKIFARREQVIFASAQIFLNKMINAKPPADSRYSCYSVSLADWRQFGEALSQIRFTVFVREQGVPPEIELDTLDTSAEKCIHAAARDQDGNIIATGRLILDEPIPRIGRMAVLKAWRGSGVGGALLDTLCQEVKRHGFTQVLVHAQTHAATFYFKRGFLSHGSEFAEAGIPHLEMRRALV